MKGRSRYRVLVVDDDPEIRSSHARIMRAFGYDVETASDGIEALAKLPLDIDLVLLDGDMPIMDGFEVARRIRKDPGHSYLPIVMVSGLTSNEDRRRALEVGVNDFISKPVDAQELCLRAKWLVDLKIAYDRLKDHEAELEEAVERKTNSLRTALEDMTEARRLTNEAYLDTIRRLMIATEYKDPPTAGHIERIGLYSRVLARALRLPPGKVELIFHASPMHDIGKLGVPDQILLKPGKLEEEEWVVMKAHTTMGAEILSGSSAPVIQLAERIALSHHEDWDGSGYPNGLSGEQIPWEGRICAVVDFFDALTTDRPYRKAVPNERVLEMMKVRAGTRFDPEMLDVFLGVIDEIMEIQAKYRPPRGSAWTTHVRSRRPNGGVPALH